MPAPSLACIEAVKEFRAVEDVIRSSPMLSDAFSADVLELGPRIAACWRDTGNAALAHELLQAARDLQFRVIAAAQQWGDRSL